MTAFFIWTPCTVIKTERGNLLEVPSSYLGGGCGISFADGHAEVHNWKGSMANRPVTYGVLHNVNVSNDPDLAWLAQHTPSQ